MLAQYDDDQLGELADDDPDLRGLKGKEFAKEVAQQYFKDKKKAARFVAENKDDLVPLPELYADEDDATVNRKIDAM